LKKNNVLAKLFDVFSMAVSKLKTGKQRPIDKEKLDEPFLDIPIEPITSADEVEEPEEKAKCVPKKICEHDEHNCIAIQLINRLICVVEEFERNIKRIQDHPSLAASTKKDIQNYINKNIVTAIWALSPGFKLMSKHTRLKKFRYIFYRSMATGAPGVLEEKKHI